MRSSFVILFLFFISSYPSANDSLSYEEISKAFGPSISEGLELQVLCGDCWTPQIKVFKCPSVRKIKITSGSEFRSKSEIIKLVRLRSQSINSAYNKFFEQTYNGDSVGFTGEVILKISITNSGRVSRSNIKASTMNNPPFDKLIARVVKDWFFPPIDSGTTSVVIPFTFSNERIKAIEFEEAEVKALREAISCSFTTPQAEDVEVGPNTLRTKTSIIETIERGSAMMRRIHVKHLKAAYKSHSPKFSGLMKLEVSIAPIGRVLKVGTVWSTTGNHLFDQNIEKEIMKWAFESVESEIETVSIVLRFEIPY